MLSRMRIVTRLFLGFAIILLGAGFLGLLGASGAMRLSSLTVDIFEHPYAVSTAILEVRADVLLVRGRMERLVHNPSAAEVDTTRNLLRLQAVRIDESLALVRQRYLGDLADVQRLEQALLELRAAREQTVALVQNGRRAEAIAHNDEQDTRLSDLALQRVQVVADYAAAKANRMRDEAEQEGRSIVRIIGIMLLLIVAGGIVLAVLTTRSVRASLRQAMGALQSLIEGSAEKVRIAQAIGNGDLSVQVAPTTPLSIDFKDLPADESGSLLKTAVRLSEVQCTLNESFSKMTDSLRHNRGASDASDWLKSGLNELNAQMRGELSAIELASKVLAYLAEYLHAGVGALYLYDERAEELHLIASYAMGQGQKRDRLRLGETLTGQAAAERRTICVTDLPPGYLPIASALGQGAPAQVLAFPLLHDDRLVGAIELGTFHAFTEPELEFMRLAGDGIAIGLGVSRSRQRVAELLEETQQQTEELRVQQEELQQSNEELEERAQLLEEQRENIRAKNRELEAATHTLRQKAEELGQVSAYKSEFLANMSHELRTPLNSLMILSSLLSQNKDGNLSDKQVEFASTIHSAGKDLLNLINDILDLSKVEAGQMQFHSGDVSPAALCDNLRALFQPLVAQKGLNLRIDMAADVPAIFLGDDQRIQQVLKNLLSNAVKFTDRGDVALRIQPATGPENPLGVPALAFAVTDTGIGISAAKQDSVFQAFHQADGSISRKYGGTGLGLSISLQLARRMGGDIRLQSEEGRGSAFTLYLPLQAAAGSPAQPLQAVAPAVAAPPAVREPLEEMAAPGVSTEKCILVIEDDVHFSRILEGIIRERGFDVLTAGDGQQGLALAERHLPSAILLDVMLPGLDGWGVMRRLKDNPRTRHIPVHFVTCMEDRQKAMTMGAIGFITKPVGTERLQEVLQSIEGSLTRSMKRLLIVEDNADEAKSMVALLEEKSVEITVASSGAQALALLQANAFDCMVLDLGLADMSGFELLEQIQAMDQARGTPVIIHSGRDLSHDDERKLRRFAESIIIKGVKSPERLLNEVTLFLHLVESNLHPSKQRMIRTALDKEAMLDGRKVLLVDDDMRNVFSLTSVLAEKNLNVIEAENGIEALARLEEHPDVGIVLMDVMMPEMDGYAAMREIRKNPRHAGLPVIAMTAKALKGDHEKCLAAGASDYISKPIDVDKLMSLIRVWLFQRN